MTLEDLDWTACYVTNDLVRYAVGPHWTIYHFRFDGLYNIVTNSGEVWEDLDVLAAQCVMHHLMRLPTG